MRLVNDSKENDIKGDLSNVSNIQIPLIYFNNCYYFCSSSSKNLIKISNNTLTYIKDSENFINLEKNFTMKCLRGKDSVLVGFIGTNYLYWYNEEKSYFSYIEEIIDKELLALDYYIENGNNNIQYSTLSFYKKNNSYFLYIFKKDNNDVVGLHTYFIDKKDLNLYSNIEIFTYKKEDAKTYIFSYDQISGNFSFYIISLEKGGNVFDGKYFFRFFKYLS